jgi:urea transport system permease protein
MRKKLLLLDRAGPLMAAFVALVIVPWLYHRESIDISTVNQLGRYLSFAIVALGIDLIWGYTGMLSLCQAMFFCLGAYAVGMHMALHGPLDGDAKDIPRCLFVVSSEVSGFKLPWIWQPFKTLPAAILLGLLMPALAAATFGYFAFRSRVRGVYFSIITQATTLGTWLLLTLNQTFKIPIVRSDLPGWFPEWFDNGLLWLFDKLNQVRLCGTNGVTNFETLAGFDVRKSGTKLCLYLLSVIAVIGTYALCRYLVNSKLGRVLVAVRDNESRLRFSGYQPLYFKVFAFAIAAMLAGLGGMLYCSQQTIVAPSDMRVEWSIIMVIWVAVGGRGTLTGAIVGTLLINFTYDFLTSRWANSWPFVQGVLFIGVVLFFPQGLVGLWRNWIGTDDRRPPPDPLSRGEEAFVLSPPPPEASP